MRRTLRFSHRVTNIFRIKRHLFYENRYCSTGSKYINIRIVEDDKIVKEYLGKHSISSKVIVCETPFIPEIQTSYTTTSTSEKNLIKCSDEGEINIKEEIPVSAKIIFNSGKILIGGLVFTGYVCFSLVVADVIITILAHLSYH